MQENDYLATYDFSVHKLTDKLLLFVYENTNDMAKAFIRISESAEGGYPNLEGRPFTIGEIMAEYSKRQGVASYYDDVGGFNISSDTFLPFILGRFDPLTEAEKQIINLVKYRTDEFYLIVVAKTQMDSLEHEIAHGLYALNKRYKEKVLKILAQHHDTVMGLMKVITTMGYPPVTYDSPVIMDMLVDEVHAFVACDHYFLLDECLDKLKQHGVQLSDLAEMAEKLEQLFAKYSQGIPRIQEDEV